MSNTNIEVHPNAYDHIKQLIAHYRAIYIPLHAPSYYEINNGQCEDFALDIIDSLGRSEDALDVCNENFMLFDGGWDWDLLKEHWNIDPPEGLSREDVDNISFGGHVFIAHRGRHFDAECIEGVKSFFDLPLFRRGIVKALRLKGIQADDVVTDDVIPPPCCPVPNPGVNKKHRAPDTGFVGCCP